MRQSNDLYSTLMDRSSQRLTYNQLRMQSKLGMSASFFVLFKSCVGLGLFSYPYAFGKVGLVWGSILTFVLCYLSTYGMYCLVAAAQELEDRSPGLLRFKTYHSLTGYLTGKLFSGVFARGMAAFSIVGCVAINGSIIIGGVVEVSSILSEYFGYSQLLLKFAITAVVVLITAVCLEPEKLKPVGFVSGGVIIAIVGIMYADNTVQTAPRNQNPAVTLEYFRIGGTGMFCGIAGFAYEAAGTIFTVKETMKEPKKMGKLLAWTFTFIGFLFIMISVSFYFVYGGELIDPVAFKMFHAERPFMHSLSIFFAVVITLFLPLYNISNSELMEDFGAVQNFVQLVEHGKKVPGEKSRTRLLLFRVGLFLATIAFAFLTDKVEVVLNFSGALIIPVICFYIPIWCNFMLARCKKVDRPWSATLHDLTLMLLAVIVQVLGLYYSIWIQILGHDK